MGASSYGSSGQPCPGQDGKGPLLEAAQQRVVNAEMTRPGGVDDMVSSGLVLGFWIRFDRLFRPEHVNAAAVEEPPMSGSSPLTRQHAEHLNGECGQVPSDVS